MEKYDVVFVGGGHSALVAAAYLAKAGVNVCVLERQPFLGGGVVTQDVDGFKHDLASVLHAAIQLNPLIVNDELKLKSKYGLEYIVPEKVCTMIFPDNTSIAIHKDVGKTCESIAKWSQKDAAMYPKFLEWAEPMVQILAMGTFNPAPPTAAMMAMLDQNEIGRELIRAMNMSSLDIVQEWFESPQLIQLMSRWTSEMMISPLEAGTGSVALLYLALLHKTGIGLPVGGSGALVTALERCFKDLGGTVRTSSTVSQIKVEGGVAKGVILDTGEEILATKAVISNLNIKQLFPDMVGQGDIPEDFAKKVKRIKTSSYSAIRVNIALDEKPHYIAEEANNSCFLELNPFYDGYLQLFDGFKYGKTAVNAPVLSVQTVFDPTRAPEGKHTLYLYHYEPYFLPEGPEHWDVIKDQIADGLWANFKNHCSNMTDDKVIHKFASSPLDLERWNPSWIHGDFMHFGQYAYQNAGNRPIPGWTRYKTPIDKLYMCGPSVHPGPAVTGGGRAAVQVVMEDLGIDFEKVIR